MTVHTLNLQFKFSISQILNQKSKNINKLCFKPEKQFLAHKEIISSKLTSKLIKKGKFLKKYKLMQSYYIDYIINNVAKLPNNNEFKNIYKLYSSFRDINRLLMWRIVKINPLFNLKIIKKKKIIYYIKKLKRVHSTTSWIKSILKLNSVNIKYNTPVSFKPLTPIILANFQKNSLNYIKLKIYKGKFLKG